MLAKSQIHQFSLFLAKGQGKTRFPQDSRDDGGPSGVPVEFSLFSYFHRSGGAAAQVGFRVSLGRKPGGPSTADTPPELRSHEPK